MADIDLLIAPEQLIKAQQLLTAHGYQEYRQAFDIIPHNHHHLPALKRANALVAIELHKAPLNASLSALLTTAEVWQQSLAVNYSGVNHLKQVSPTHQFILAVGHSELADQHFVRNTLNLRQLHIIYKIASHYQQQIDWQQVIRHFQRVEQLAVLSSVAYRLQHFFALTVLDNIIEVDLAEKRLERAVKRYLKNQADIGRFAHLKAYVAGYRPSVIKALYGGENFFALVNGYYRHIRRHLAMLIRFMIVKEKT